MIWLLSALIACTPQPYAGLEEDLGRALSASELEQLPDYGVYVVLQPDTIAVGGFGSWSWIPGDEPAVQERITRHALIPLRDGQCPKPDLRGSLCMPLYDELLGWAEFHKDVGHWTETYDDDFTGEVWFFIDLRSRDDLVRAGMFTAGQAQFGNFHLLPSGPILGQIPAAVPSVIGPQADATRRLGALSTTRVGSIDGQEAYLIDERPSRIRIDTAKGGEPSMITGADTVVSMMRRATPDIPVYSSYAAAAASAEHPILPSLEMLLHLSKRVDDDLLASLARSREPIRRTWVDQAVQTAAELGAEEARAWLDVAQQLAEGKEPALAKDFLDDKLQSLPIGSYGEDEALGRGFRRDRWLNQDLHYADKALRSQLVQVLSDPAVAPGLAKEREHRSVWTNPAYRKTLENGGDFVLAPARNNETTWVDAQGGTIGVQHMMEEWVAAIQRQEASIALSEDSGFYDRQQWALEPLLTHPVDALVVGPGYHRRLKDAFMAGVALRRESQAKDLSLPAIGSALPDRSLQAYIAPSLRIEPVPTHYQRQAEVYSWLLEVALSRRELADPQSWALRVDGVRALYAGAAAISSADLGIAGQHPTDDQIGSALSPAEDKYGPPLQGRAVGLGTKPSAEVVAQPEPRPNLIPASLEPIPAPEAERLEQWLSTWQEDPIMGEDVRVMVPAGPHSSGGVISWAILGVRTIDLVVSYDKPPAISAIHPDTAIDVHLVEQKYTVLAPLFVEVITARPLTRAELRAVADDHARAGDIVEALRSEQ